MEINMPIFSNVIITPEKIVSGELYTVSAVVSDSPVPVYPVSVYSNEVYSGEEYVLWP